MRYEQLQKTSLYRDLLFSRNRMFYSEHSCFKRNTDKSYFKIFLQDL